MEDTLTHSHTSAAVGSTDPIEPAERAAAESALLLPYEESSQKVRELALKQLNRLMSYEAKVLKGDDANAGSFGAAWRSVAIAWGGALPGVTVWLCAGTCR